MKSMEMRLLKVVLLIVMLSGFARPQAGAPSTADTGTDQSNSPPAEKKVGAYVTKQSVEFGYRFTDVSSSSLNPGEPTNLAMYNTLVNLHTGPRLLEQNLSMQSPEHSGVLFDNLFVSSSGFGGDPNDLARARVSKYKWYDFSALFRRDWNFFDYDLFANPLNPLTSSPAVFIVNSPHSWNSVRRMTDLDLTLMPQSSISFRVGYSRNVSEGPSLTTIPEASDAEAIETELVQHNKVSTDSYRFGVDFKLLPGTNISYDQFITHTHNDTSWNDQSFPWVLPNGTPADLGISWNTVAGSPCAAPFSPAPPAANPLCSLYLAYARTDHMRNNVPTEQLSIQSNYFQKLNLSGRASYSSLNFSGPFNDFFNGFLADSGTRQYTTTGPMNGREISASADFGATLQVTRRLRLNDKFRFYSFRIPSFWNSITQTWLGISALSPVAPTPDLTDNSLFARFLGENTTLNEVSVDYNFTKSIGATIGYRFRSTQYRAQDEVSDLTSGDIETGEDIIPVNFHTGLLGIWLRPSDKLRANFDLESTTADNFLTRISPRRLLRYRVRTRYQPVRWATISATADVYEARNGITEISFNSHNRNFGVNATVTRGDRMGLEFAYNYNNAVSNAFICFQSVVGLLPLNTFGCAADTEGGAPFEIYQTYTNQDHFGTATLLLKPVKRLSTNLGYSIVSSNGSATFLNPLQPYGSLKSNFHRPLADLECEVAPGWTAIARWNYYEYLEKTAFFGPTAPRNFHANLTTLSLRYAF